MAEKAVNNFHHVKSIAPNCWTYNHYNKLFRCVHCNKFWNLKQYMFTFMIKGSQHCPHCKIKY